MNVYLELPVSSTGHSDLVVPDVEVDIIKVIEEDEFP